LDGLPIIGASNIKTLNETGTQEHLNASEDMHLTLNLHTLMDWFVSRVFPTQRYCPDCKAAKRKAVFGNQQVAVGKCCPQCGLPRHMLGRNGNTGHLPLITSAKAGLKVYGGWRVAMTSFRMSKPAFNALLRASQGRIPVEEALRTLMTLPVDVRQQDKKTTWVKHRLVPVVYEVVHSTGGEHQLLHGLALEPIHLGDL
jgi:rubredoxin